MMRVDFVRGFFRLLSGVLSLSLGGCVYVPAPLTDPANSTIDTKLIGTWQWQRDEGTYLTIRPVSREGNPPGLMEFKFFWSKEFNSSRVLTPRDNRGFAAFSTGHFTVSTVGDHQYANIFRSKTGGGVSYAHWLSDKDKTCLIVRYQVVDRQLTFWRGNDNVFAQLLRDKVFDKPDMTASLVRHLTDAERGVALFSHAEETYARAMIDFETFDNAFLRIASALWATVFGGLIVGFIVLGKRKNKVEETGDIPAGYRVVGWISMAYAALLGVYLGFLVSNAGGRVPRVPVVQLVLAAFLLPPAVLFASACLLLTRGQTALRVGVWVSIAAGPFLLLGAILASLMTLGLSSTEGRIWGVFPAWGTIPLIIMPTSIWALIVLITGVTLGRRLRRQLPPTGELAAAQGSCHPRMT
jgi:hypothetical protein